jgi:hypothetical protein
MLDKAIRDLDRERMGLQNQEKRIITDIKKMAKEGQMVGSAAPGQTYRRDVVLISPVCTQCAASHALIWYSSSVMFGFVDRHGMHRRQSR